MSSSIVGHPPNFWMFSAEAGWDLTRSSSPNADLAGGQLRLETTTAPITIDTARTALVIIDMQNFFLSAALGRTQGEGHTAQEALLQYAIPAARRAKIQIVWVSWGISDAELLVLPPIIHRIFGYNIEGDEVGALGKATEEKGGLGIGDEIGDVKLSDGTVVPAGRLLVRDQWNTALHDPLEAAYAESLATSMPDVKFHKARLSPFWGGSNKCADFLYQNGITTLLFGGVNTDQCVLATIQDACNRGFDTVLLQDGCGTSSPDFTKRMVAFNCRKSWGFVSSCEALAKACRNM